MTSLTAIPIKALCGKWWRLIWVSPPRCQGWKPHPIFFLLFFSEINPITPVLWPQYRNIYFIPGTWLAWNSRNISALGLLDLAKKLCFKPADTNPRTGSTGGDTPRLIFQYMTLWSLHSFAEWFWLSSKIIRVCWRDLTGAPEKLMTRMPCSRLNFHLRIISSIRCRRLNCSC